jgi:hypothetical protein
MTTTLRGKIPEHEGWLFRGYTVSQKRGLKEAREAGRQEQYPDNQDQKARKEGIVGKGKSCPLCEGQKVESEHAKTLESVGIPKEKVKEAETKIAQDHIKEDPNYYFKLKEMEKGELTPLELNAKIKALYNQPPLEKPPDKKPEHIGVGTRKEGSESIEMGKAMTAGSSTDTGSNMMHSVADGEIEKDKFADNNREHEWHLKVKRLKRIFNPEPEPDKESWDRNPKADIHKAYPGQISSKDESDEKEIRNLRLKSKLSPSIKDLKEVQEVSKDVKKEWALDLAGMLSSDRDISGTFHKPVIDKENDIIPATAMDSAMDDFMILPTLQEVHTERTVGIITKTWKTGDDEYKFEGKIKPGDDCDDVWKKVKSGEYDGLSIGGRRIKYSQNCAIPSSIRTTPCVTHKLKLYNVSVCSSPVNPEATMDDFNKVAKSTNIIKAESTESNNPRKEIVA